MWGDRRNPVRAVEAFGGGRFAPWSDVAGFQVGRVIHERHATTPFLEQDLGPEDTLTAPSPDDLFSELRVNRHPITFELAVA